MDLADLDTLPHKIDRLLAHHNALRRGMNLEEIDGKGILNELTAFAPKLLPYAETVWRLAEELAYLDRVRSVTADQVRVAARRYLDPERYGRIAFVPSGR